MKIQEDDHIPVKKSMNEIILPIAHYTIFNSNYKKTPPLLTISIYGLGSCIALILYDTKNQVAGMSHILLPKSNKEGSLKYPHKFADTSVQHLMEKLILHGAEKEKINAAIVGGANIFENSGCMVGTENIFSVKKALIKSNINVEKEHLGGNSGRIIKFEPKKNIIWVKLTGEKEFISI